METVQVQPPVSTPPQKSSADTLAIVSLIFGILSFIPLVGWLTLIVALVCGIIALVQKTRKMISAILGIVFSLLGVFIIGPLLTLITIGIIGSNLNGTFSKVGEELKKQEELQKQRQQNTETPTELPPQNTNGQ